MSQYRINIGTVSLIIPNLTASTATLNCPLSVTGGLTLSTPLTTASGGTGLSTVGTSGQYLSSNGTTLSWVNPSAGTGSVTSVSLAVDSTLSGFFDNTGTATVTTTGTFTLSQAPSPAINIDTASKFRVVKNTASSSVPNIDVDFGTGPTARAVDVFGALTIGGSVTSRYGRNSGTGNHAILEYMYVNTNSASNRFLISMESGQSIDIRKNTITASTLAVTSLTATQAVFTDASKNLVSVATTGTGSAVLSTSPILSTPTLGVADATAINLPPFVTTVPKISMFGPPPNNFQYDGFSSDSNTLVYNVAGDNNNHIFFAAASASTKTELFRVKGTGGFTSNGVSTISGDLGVAGNINFTGSITGGVNITTYFVTSGSSWPNAVDTSPSNWSPGPNIGSQLTNTGGGTFQNNLGVTIYVNVIYSTRRDSNAFGSTDIWIREDVNSLQWGRLTVGGVDWLTTTATFRLNSGNSLTLFGFQNSGSNLNFIATSRLSIQIYRV